MEELNFSVEEVKDAYLKLKNHIYYDKSALFNRLKLAQFEQQYCIYDEMQDIDSIFEEDALSFWEKLKNNINNILNNTKIRSSYLEQISAKIIPKNILTQLEFNNKNKDLTDLSLIPQLISNRTISKQYRIEDINYYIDLPVELLIIDTLWTIKCGLYLSSETCNYLQVDLNECSYANKLYLNEDGQIKPGKKLFKHYYRQYPKWRDNAIKEVERLYQSNKNSLIFSLDIKKYYYSINLNYAQISDEIVSKSGDTFGGLTDILQQIHFAFKRCLQDKYKTSYENNLLPIGLLSSNILSNWYLKKFDKQVLNVLKPVYYGRYVDDLLFVFEDKFLCSQDFCTDDACPEENKLNESSLINAFLSQIVETVGQDKLKIKAYDTLFVQKNKVKIFLVDANSPNVVLEQFKTNISATTSQFQFLPDDKEIDDEYVKKTFFVHYTDSVNKLRSVEKCTLDKFSTSVLLSKKIQIAKYMNETISQNSIKKIINNYFSGKNSLILNSLWYKVFTYLIIINKPYSLGEIVSFYKHIDDCIDKIKYSPAEAKSANAQISKKIRKDLREHLNISLSLALSLNPNIKLDKFIKKKDEIYTNALKFRYANLFLHDHISLPGYNYTFQFFMENFAQDYKNLVEKDISKFFDSEGNFEELFDITEKLYDSSPLDITIEDKSLLDFYSLIFNPNNKKEYQNDINDKIAQKIQNLNTPAINIISKGDCNEISINSESSEPKIKIGVSNLHVLENDITTAIKKKSHLSEKKYSQIREIITQAQNNEVDLLIFPEVSIPLEWLSLLYKHLANKKMGMILGLEHFSIKHSGKKYCYNFLVTMLPCSLNDSKPNDDQDHSSFMFIKPRLKNYYSPDEKRAIKENLLEYPNEPTNISYDLFKWHGVYFSTYNCYEIACISDRAIMKSKVDFLSISEWNKDTKYFDNIIKSASRDLHCYIVQVNTSNYGHSCIIAPKKSEESMPLFIKGGLNSTLLVEELDFKKLRAFQLKNPNYCNDTNFKALPPRFDQENARLLDN